LEQNRIFGNKKLLSTFKKQLELLTSKKGSIVVVNGESGFGKSHILNYLQIIASENKKIANSIAQAANPIGKLRVGNLQPLLPFAKSLENLMDNKTTSAEKRFAMNVSMSLLASLPVAGDLFYAIKEIGRDWRQFKNERSSASSGKRKVSTATADYYDTYNAFCDKTTAILFLDDMHWADAQSVELLTLFADSISDIPLMIVLTLKPSIIESTALPIQSFINTCKNNNNVHWINLESFDFETISTAANIYLLNYQRNNDFERWLFEKTQGLPLSVIEYLKYINGLNPFDENGNFSTAKLDRSFIPASLQALVSDNMEHLSEEDRNLLAVCSSEGVEFTVAIISKLTNYDVLTTIKKLRSIQTRTGVIRSLGATYKYGEKTTVYKFNQSFYHSYFEKTLEYEEYTMLHSQISNLLKEKYEQAKLSEVREQIAPYIAAHSAEAGDSETAETMLMLSAESAKKYGNPDVIKELYQDYILLTNSDEDNIQNQPKEEFSKLLNETNCMFFNSNGEFANNNIEISNDGNNVTNNSATTYFDFILQYNNLTELFIESNFDDVIFGAKDILDKYLNVLNTKEKFKLDILMAKAYVDKFDLLAAKRIIDDLEIRIAGEDDKESLCFFYNLKSIIESTDGNITSAKHYLNLAAELAVSLSPEMRLLTISNISIIQKDDKNNSKKYLNAAKKLAKDMNMQNFLADLEREIVE